MRLRSLRVRLMIAYAGLIVVGFGGLALAAGQQISNAARDDYKMQLANEVILVAQGLVRPVRDFQKGDITQEELDETVAEYESQTGAALTLFLLDPSSDQAASRDDRDGRDRQPPGDNSGDSLPEDWRIYPEVVSAGLNVITVVQRGHGSSAASFTAAPITDGPRVIGYVQFSEPTSQLDRALVSRWSALGLGVLVMTGLALLASAWLSTSLIRPLDRLRDSALRLAQGDLSHRITDHGSDEIGQVAQSFNRMADRVEAMIEEQRAFASNTSHELRTPLTTMRLRTEALRRDPTLSESDRQQYVVEIDEELIRLSGLIEDLILLSRFDAGRAEVGRETINLNRFAHSLHTSFSGQTAEKGITLRLELPPDDSAHIEASLNHLTILFRNLLDNAIKYTPAGGTILWRITTTESEALFSVADNGLGIAPDHLPHLFERFYRADKARSRHIQGTGLGLALAKSIAEAYGGRIEITSQGLGHGTTVITTWPITRSSD